MAGDDVSRLGEARAAAWSLSDSPAEAARKGVPVTHPTNEMS